MRPSFTRAHGAGTLCGKALSKKSSSTIGEEKNTNWSLQNQTEDEFVKALLHDQPFVPAYFAYDVALNKKGAANFATSVNAVKISEPVTNGNRAKQLNPLLWIIDIRDEKEYKAGHLPHALNLMQDTKFETWLGSIIKPGEQFYLAGADEKSLKAMIERAAAIGYEGQIAKAFVLQFEPVKQAPLDVAAFTQHTDDYTIIDVRNTSEAKEKSIFADSLNIPLGSLRERVGEIPTNKPVVVHCASGYRSAAGSSLLQSTLNGTVPVFDLGVAVKGFMK